MLKPPDPPRGLALLLRHHRRGDESIRPLAQAVARRLSADVGAKLGLRIGLAAEDEIGDADELEVGQGVEARYAAGGAVATLRFSQAAIYDLIEAMFGGDGSNQVWREPREPTALERAICQNVAEALAEPMGEAFGASGLAFDGLEDRPGAPREGGVEIALRMRVIGRESRIVLRAPSAWRGEAQGETRRESARGVIGDCVADVELPLRVLLRDRSLSIADVADLREGQILSLSATSRSPTLLEASGVGMFHCRLGQSEGRYTVQIERALAAPAADA